MLNVRKGAPNPFHVSVPSPKREGEERGVLRKSTPEDIRDRLSQAEPIKPTTAIYSFATPYGPLYFFCKLHSEIPVQIDNGLKYFGVTRDITIWSVYVSLRW
jgi:hypothetical protein